ncbi:MAG: sugar transferase, partial [Chloroflexota bacterium]|nr:sugar transferase [Chloroflexota bacterium]
WVNRESLGSQTKRTDNGDRLIRSGFGLKGFIYWGLSLVLFLAIWFFTFQIAKDGGVRAAEIILMGILYALFTVFLIKALRYTSLARAWCFRLPFLISVGMAGFQFFLLGIVSGNDQFVPYFLGSNETQVVLGLVILLFFSILSSFGGALFASSLEDGLWEDNAPPPADIKAEVFQRHLQVIGVPGIGPSSKRWFDTILAAFGVLISMPVWMMIVFLIWLEDPGPLLFVKNSVGKGGVNFRQFKFRTMVRGAEERTGPVLSEVGDERVLVVGRLLRKTALDELPQLINILTREMSFVGPRPQRTVLVLDYLMHMPEYAERHQVLPGLSGLAQVAGDYYLTPRQKLRFDRIYIQHMSLGFDIKLLVLAFLITFWYRWQKNWDGRLPRKLLHPTSPEK